MKPLKVVLTPTRNRRLNELVGLVLLVAAGLLLLALVSYRPSDPSLNTVVGAAGAHTAENWVGVVGAALSDLLFQFDGVAAFCLPLMLILLGISWMRSRVVGSPIAKLAGFLLYLLFAPAALALLPGHLHWRGAVPVEGVLGRLTVDTLTAWLNFPGTCVVVLAILAVAMLLTTTFSFSAARQWLLVRFAFVYTWRDRVHNWKLRRKRLRIEAAADRNQKQKTRTEAAVSMAGRPTARGSLFAAFVSRFGRKAEEEDEDDTPLHRRAAFAETQEDAAYLQNPPATPSLWEQMPRATVPDPEPEVEPVLDDEEYEAPFEAAPFRDKPEPELPVAPRAHDSISIGERADADVHLVTVPVKSVSGFRLPPTTLLHRSEDSQIVREDELREEATVLVEKCAEFDVRGQVTQINPGPVVTTFEFRPEAGVKYSRVTGLADDLCLAMAAESILIERMAGKSTVGIQVPNSTRETIWLRDVVEAENFVHSKSRLTLAMGKDINGRIVTADLATMPHVLIAGSTGSGKSVAINAMIMSVLYKTTPEQVRMILVDPKRVELGMYEGIPHLFTPIITEPKLAANALRNAVREMERRLKLLASRSVRNIDQYNKLFDNGTPSMFEDAEEQKPLPYIIIIIDELADLMMLDKANVEEAITRLAQMARAVGIHLILATQRPSVDVITGLIKANVPTRISFRLSTKVDSRTILDSNGAEALLGRGDMLFLPPGTSRLQRVHAPFVTEAEISAVVDFWKTQGQAEYVEGFLESPKDEKGRDLDGDGDGG
ncbi:MAG: DNA translocase FtsK, partial [Acidobacteriaceae bacterium]